MKVNNNFLFIKRNLYYFENTSDSKTQCDIACFFNLFEKPFDLCTQSKTYITNLINYENINNLFSNLNNTTRNAINRCNKEGYFIVHIASDAITKQHIKGFIRTLRGMYKEKNIKSKVNKKNIINHIKNNAIILSYSTDGKTNYTYHMYVHDSHNCVLWFSCSLFRNKTIDKNLIGRLNRFHHYDDLAYFKSKNYTNYDWGGVSSFENPNGIDLFKYSFPGEKKTVYSYAIAHSKKGVCFSKIKSIQTIRSGKQNLQHHHS